MRIFFTSSSVSVIDVAVVDATGRVNVALNRPSWSSSLHCDGADCHSSDRAFDGVGAVDHYVTAAGCVHGTASGEFYPWTAVDLLAPMYVDGVDVTARGDCCGT